MEIGDNILIITNNWFYAPDGQSYRAVFGTLKGIRSSEETLGIKTNYKSTNWYIEIGNMIIAGCQVDYAIKTDQCNFQPALHWTSDAANGIKEYFTPCGIYFAD